MHSLHQSPYGMLLQHGFTSIYMTRHGVLPTTKCLTLLLIMGIMQVLSSGPPVWLQLLKQCW